MRKTNWPGRRASLAFGTALVLVAGSLAFSGTSGAANPPGYQNLANSTFEIETNANLLVNLANPSIDWLTGGAGTALRPEVITQADLPTGGGDDSFGQGTKEDTAVPKVVDGSIPPNKSDLKQFGLYQETTAAGSFLHLFWTRVQDPSGTTNMDFEFNQNQCTSSTPVPATCPNGVTPKRLDGDLLITYDLSNGGTVASMSMRVWSGSAWGSVTAFDGTTAVGTVNTTGIDAGNSGGLGALSARTFGEASINLDEVFPDGFCTSFGSAYLKSRSADSFTSALKDFIAPELISLSNCGSVNIHKQDDSGAPVALGGVNFKLYNDVNPTVPVGVRNLIVGGVTDANDDTLTSPVLQCTTATTPPATLGNCTISNVPFGQYWVVETAPPTGYLSAPDQHIAISREAPTPGLLTFTDNRNPATLSIHKQDDDSPANPLGDVRFTLYTDNAPLGPGTTTAPVPRGTEDTINSTLTCLTNASGDCTITGIAIAGPYWVVETTSKPGYDPAPDQHVVTVAGGSNTTAPLTFVNARNFKVIVLVCNESVPALYPSEVTINGQSAGTSPSTAPSGLTQAALCGITDGDLGGLSSTAAGSYPATVAIRP